MGGKHSPPNRRTILKKTGATALGSTLLSGAGQASSDDIKAERLSGEEKRSYVQKAIQSYETSKISQKGKKRGYEVTNKGAKVTRHDLLGETSVFVALSLDKESREGIAPPSVDEESETRDYFQRFVWSNNSEFEDNLLVETSGHLSARSFEGRYGENAISTGIPEESVSIEVITPTNHEINIFHSGNYSTKGELEHIGFDLTENTVKKSSSEPLTTQPSSNCNMGYSATMAAIIGCSGGCSGCYWSLFTRNPREAIITCSACAACSIELYCCLGAAAPDSVCSSVRNYVLTHASDPDVIAFYAGAGQFFLDGCASDGASCPA